MEIRDKEAEKELIIRCIRGEKQCFASIYEHYYHKMLYLCKRYSGSMEEAEDLVQEGFAKAYEKMKDFEFKGSFEGWLRRLMVNNAITKFRRKSAIMFVSSDKYENQDKSYEFASDVEDVFSIISSKEIYEHIVALPPAYRMVFNLYAIEGYSHREISEILDIAEVTSRSNLLRARNILKNKVQAQLEYQGEKRKA